MEKYRNLSGKSGVHSYEIGNDYIRVNFFGNLKTYQYSYQGKAGQSHVEKMKYLASTGSGLNSYIDQFVKYKYD
jgi:hypothetical protein